MANAQGLQTAPAPSEAAGALPAKKSSARPRIIAGVVAVVVVTAGSIYYVHSLSYEDTDDAQVDGDISVVSPRVSGTIKTVLVSENQHVNAGDLLAEIDSADYEVALAQARANVALASAQLHAEQPSVAITQTSNGTLIETSHSDVGAAAADVAGAEASLKQAEAQLVEAEANEKLATTELDRTKSLYANGTVSKAEMDLRTAAYDVAHSSTLAADQARSAASQRVNQTRAHLAASASRVTEVQQNAPRQVETRKANVDIRQASLDLAQAQLHQAELNVGYARVLAPVAGVVGKKSVNIGDRVQPGQQILAITQIERLWVTANFRETQLKSIRRDQPVSIHVDALGADFEGTVDTIGGATGSRFSLLPPENATGNYVKVVQRIPVRIQFNPGQSGLDALRPGLSVEPKVRVK